MPAPEYADESPMIAVIYQPETSQVALFRQYDQRTEVLIAFADENYYYAVESGDYVPR